MHYALLILALALPVSAQVDEGQIKIALTGKIAGVEGGQGYVIVDTNNVTYRALQTLVASQVAIKSQIIVTLMNSTHSSLLDTSGITLQIDRIDRGYMRVAIPQVIIAEKVHGSVIRSKFHELGGSIVSIDSVRCSRPTLNRTFKWLNEIIE